MRTKKIIVLILSAICLTAIPFGLIGCGDNVVYEKKVTAGEPKYEYVYSSYYDGENDDFVTIDGKLDEDCWQDKKWYTSQFYTDLDDNMPMIASTAFNTEYGVYIGVKIRDNNITYNGMLDLTKNSVLEYYFYANKDDEVTRDNDYSQRRAFMMDYACDLYSTGERMKRAVVVDGEINSGETKGATFELFIPWAELDIDVSDGIVPELFFMVPAYRPVLKGRTSQTPLFNVPFNLMNRIAGYYVFDEDGYTDEDAEGAIVGDAINGTAKTGCWDIENAADEENPSVSVTKGTGNNSIYFRDAYCENFEAEATLYPLGGNLTDQWWVGGFLVLSTNGANYMMTLEMGPSRIKEVGDGGYALNQFALWTLATRDDPYMWNQRSLALRDNPETQGDSVPEDLGTTFKIIKYGNTVCYFVNGEYLYSETLDLLNGAFYVGLYNMNGFCAYKNLSFKAYDDEDARARLEELRVYNVSVDIMSSGGNATAECDFVNVGAEAKIDLTNYSGYKLSSVKCNDEEIIDKVMKNAVDGIYTIENVSENIHLEVYFEEIENAVTFTGELLNGESPLGGNITLISKKSGALKYETLASIGGFELELEPGEYKIAVNGYFGSDSVVLSGDTTESDVCVNTFEGAKDLYSGTTVYEFGGELTYKVTQTGAMVLKDAETDGYVEVEQGKPFMIYAKLRKSSLTGVGFVVGTLGEDNSKHIMFNWRPSTQDIYVTREGNGDNWNWTGHADKLFPCTKAFDADTEIALVYINDVYLFVIDGSIVANIPTSFDNNWGGKLNIGEIIGTEGNKKFGISVLIGTLGISKYGYSLDIDEINDYLGMTPLYKGVTTDKQDTECTINATRNDGKVGAFIIDGAEVEQNKPFMIHAKVLKQGTVTTDAMFGVGFVVGTLGEDNSKHIMFNWRTNVKDIYVSREENGSAWGWRGHADKAYPCTKTLGDVTEIALIYMNGMYMFVVDGSVVANFAEGTDIGWGTVPKTVIGTDGNKKFGLSVIFGAITIAEYGYTLSEDEINAYLGIIPLQKGITVNKQGTEYLVNATEKVGAFIVGDKEVNVGEDFMISVKVKDIKAENVGFAVGTLGSDNSAHLMFDWRNKGANKDIYIWRGGAYGWKGHDDNKYSCTLDRSGEHTMTLVCKSGIYYMYIDGTQVFNKAGSEDIGWGTVINNIVGTTGTIKIGLTTSFGTATFSDFEVTTDAAKINAAIAG